MRFGIRTQFFRENLLKIAKINGLFTRNRKDRYSNVLQLADEVNDMEKRQEAL